MYNTVSRLSSSASASRVSSAVSNIVSSGGVNPNSLSNVISNIAASVAATHPGLSQCEVLVQTLMEVVSVLVHILGSANLSSVNFYGTGQSTNTVGSAFTAAMG